MPPKHTFRSVAYTRYLASERPDYKKLAASYERIVGSRLEIEPSWRCLDVACGKGNFLAFLRAQGVANYLGVDITEGAIAFAIQEFGADKVIQADALRYLSNQQSAFDLITALDFVEHVTKEELSEFLTLSYEALSKNGLFLIRTPNPNAPFGMAARYNDVTHEICFTAAAFSDFARRFGFRVIKVWEDFGVPRTAKQLAHFVAWRVIDAVYRVMEMIESGNAKSPPMTRNYWLLLSKS